MKKIPRTAFPFVILIIIAIGGLIYIAVRNSIESQSMVVSGTIEVTNVKLSTMMGGTVDQVYADEGQNVNKGQVIALVMPASTAQAGYTEKVRSPIDGVVLDRQFEPGELAMAGSTILTVGDLSKPTLTIYVPEEQYGKINLDETLPVTVDSFPGEVFNGVVTYISDQAEFTPRNVQTIQGRKDTVYAVKLSLQNPDFALKPGMPADVTISLK
jgi:multidrug efflux pump subunit AcrA (membrane-fusion protein)